MYLEAAAVCRFVLKLLDFLVTELFHMSALQAHDMVVMTAFVELEHGFAALEMMAHQQTSLLKLRQYAIYGCQANIVTRIDHHLIDIFCGQVTLVAFLEQLKDFKTR